jgi:hypothetical protein
MEQQRQQQQQQQQQRRRPPATQPAAPHSKKLLKRLAKWLDSYEAVASCIEAHGDLEQQLADNGGFVKLRHFLPTAVAEGVLALLESLDDAEWNVRVCVCVCVRVGVWAGRAGA